MENVYILDVSFNRKTDIVDWLKIMSGQEQAI